MSRIFIDRPIFAWVIAIIIMLCGLGAIFSLPVEQFPDVAPPNVNIRATYPGASADTLENSVAQVIEQQLTGIDGLLYFSTNSSSKGNVSIGVTFAKGTDPDIAQVQVQNKVQQALSRLPQQVQQQGLTVTKSNADFLLIAAIYDTTDQRTNQDVSDYMVSNLQEAIGRLPGVGDTQVFGSQYAMRIWLNPDRLAAVGLNPGDITTAITAQNTEVAAGEVGGVPSGPDQYIDATVTAQSRLSTPAQFRDIVVKTQPDGSAVHLSDVARIELGAENYGIISRINGHPGSGIAVSLAPGADALTTAELVKGEVENQSKRFPTGFAYDFPQDSTAFIKLSVKDVVWTLFEAIVLVVVVMFVFLQSWRATLIPTIAVPVVLLGTFGVFAVAGFTINTLTLFGLVLAIGLLVDDAIVVVENVERVMEENPGMSPRDATIQSMGEIQIALVAIALVLSAVFLPMAFFGGSTGVIYRQFSLTIVSAMVLSVVVALILTPALTATLLKRKEEEEDTWLQRKTVRARKWFNDRFARGVERYTATVERVVDRKWLFLGIYAVVLVLLVLMFVRLPTGFLPTEDQGVASIQFNLPSGATINRTSVAQRQIEHYFLTDESKNVDAMLTVAGSSGNGGGGQNAGRGFVALKDWSERKGNENTAEAITSRATKALSGLRDVEFYALQPAAVRGLGQSNGFTLELQNTGSLPRADFLAARDKLVALARKDTSLAAVRVSDLPDQPTLRVDVDPQKLSVLGLTQTDVNTTLSTAWGGRYVNDFNDRGRVKRVFVQGDAPYRSKPEDLSQWQVRAANGQMVPFSSFAKITWSTAPTSLSRFSGISSYEIQGQAAPGESSGSAMNEMEKLAAQIPGTAVAWSGLSYQERLSSGQAPYLYALSLLVVFLCLAALYESWTIPVAVLLVIPLGLVGAIFAVTLRGLQNDVYLQIGLLTTMGLAAKNAILMIEFAEQAEKQGKRVIVAAIEAARIRIRPILMTSLAFIFGVLPLAIATGAGANSRVAIGTSVIGGMLTATILAVFYIPLFFVLVRRTTRDALKRLHHEHPTPPPQPEASA
ncbi:MAG: multidrug transporter [Sphingomonas bacterium]|uniref:efflux RND transporter permease subunit n=1 Tax=Sphingomonas bacterium TaxID=1895847 RepID=UPI002615FD29|nr:efflux RND transporter permease subunit [Sphingomonas bacterium]MDB5710554.1 multidrug transporter [Sphingomonas bacterium]